MPYSKDNLPKNVEGMNLSEHQIDIFVSAANNALKEYGDDVKAIKVGIAAAIQKENDLIKGGLADNMSIEDIAKKHNVNLSDIKKQLELGIKVEHEHTDSDEEAAEIAKDHLFENPKYYVKNGTDKDTLLLEKHNSKDWAKTYKASNFIEKGVCTYNDETIYLSQDCLNKAIQSIKGRPVVIKHQKVTPQNMEDHAVGYVSDCGFCDQEASFYCNFLVFDDEGKEVIAKDYSVSCAYIPKAFGIGGTWHNTPYDREVTELEFTHLALVPDPRYEDAKIYENSKDTTQTDNTTKETYNMEKIEVEQGFLASLIELAQKPFLNSKKEEKEEPKDKEDAKVDDDEMEYEGKKYSKKELVNAYESACAGKKKEEEKEMKNEKEAEEEAEKENSKDEDMEFFNSMQKLMAEANTDADDKIVVHSQNKGLELGSKAFG